MSEEQKQMLMIKGLIASLPAADQEACLELAEHIRSAIGKANETVGACAIALVGMEMQLKKEGVV